MKTIRKQILEFINYELELNIDKDEVREFEEKIDSENDFYIDIDGNEYRVINEDAIWDIYVDSIRDLTEECYLINEGAKQWWIAIDWEKTAENCYNSDGYGHHFSSYDGTELECKFGQENYYIFRTN